MRMKMKLILFAVLLGLILCQATPAVAEQQVGPSCDNVSMTKTNWVAGSTPGVDPITIQLFNSSLGVLKRVEISVQACVDQTANFTNTANETVDPNDPDTWVSIDTGAYVESTLLDGSKLRATSATHSEPYVEVNETIQIIQDNECKSESATINDQARLADYIASAGVTTKTLPTRASGFTWMDGSGNLEYAVSTKASAEVCVTYYYEPCDDGNVCNGIETSNGIACTAGIPLACDDSNKCTADSCDPATGCVNTDISASCDDQNKCTADSCDPAIGCVNADISASCDDNNACTTDSCDPATGCAYEPVYCADSDMCTIDECDPAIGCTHEEVDCDDSNECTADSCDPATGCISTPITCNDNDLCTIDSCDPATGCIYTPVDCDDGDDCTEDYCDPNTGGCVHEYICVSCETAMANWGMDDPAYPDVGAPGHVNDGFLKNARWGWYTIVDRSALEAGITSDVWAAAGNNDLSNAYRVGTVTISVDSSGYLDWNFVPSDEYSCSDDSDIHVYVSNQKNSKNGFGLWYQQPQTISLNSGDVYVAFHDGSMCCNFH